MMINNTPFFDKISLFIILNTNIIIFSTLGTLIVTETNFMLRVFSLQLGIHWLIKVKNRVRMLQTMCTNDLPLRAQSIPSRNHKMAIKTGVKTQASPDSPGG